MELVWCLGDKGSTPLWSTISNASVSIWKLVL